MTRFQTKIQLASCATALFLAQCVARAASQETDLRTRIQAQLAQTFEIARYPGVTVAVVLPDGQVFTGAAGWADTAHRVPLKPTDRMPAGSVGKTFVAAIILKAVDDGKLDLDSRIERW